ncbi:hypothetical protein [Flavobacterium gelatinilyticum]|uniref:hypothetical protein n=1 Tax=Flavobacterium gelatinilyticum TaxID=3003260 RepID=UPI002480791D|nr:hypothetical protein [Flavobacterium gelatinilyticum]
MKNYVTFTLLIFFIISCNSSKDLKRLDSKSFSGKNNVLGLNAINANNNYYTKAIIDYLLIKKIIDGNSIREFGIPKNNPKNENTEKVLQIALFPELSTNTSYANTNTDATITKLLESGIRTCFYDLPLKLKDLQSGFQFNHYVFKSSNRAAMQAFGIVNSEVKENSLYIITDYLQYQDINCSGLPTIRYAVGIRAEFRIIGIESESQLQGIGSLAGLAAQVETNSQKVNLTIKTIGLTGIDSRLSIPSNTTFDVKTYSDYEKIIDFIRNLKDNEDKEVKDNKQLIVQPQIIPVMDEYRASLEYSFYPMLESIELLELKLRTIEKNNLSQIEIDTIKKNINSLKLSILQDETKDLIRKYRQLNNNYNTINSTSNITEIFTYLNRKSNIESSLEQFSKDTTKDSLAHNTSKKTPKIIDLVGGRNVLIAKEWEEKGFDYILSKEFDKAIFAFKQSEIEVPQFHSSSEIVKFLNDNKSKITNNNNEYLKALKIIRENYTWRVSEEIIKKLDTKLKP